MSKLTIKWITKHPGGEVTRIFQADEFTVAFADQQVGLGVFTVAGRDCPKALAIIGYPFDLGNRSLGCGKVYVMNESGKTVGSYDLGDDMVPGTDAIGPGPVPQFGFKGPTDENGFPLTPQ